MGLTPPSRCVRGLSNIPQRAHKDEMLGHQMSFYPCKADTAEAGLNHARLPCPSPSPGACSNSCPSSQWCHPTISSSVVPFSSCPQSFQHQGLFKWVSSSYQVAKILEFQLQHQTFQWTPRRSPKGLIFRMDWLDLFAVQGTLKSLLQHHSSKASILRCWAFFIVQLSHPYMTMYVAKAFTMFKYFC